MEKRADGYQYKSCRRLLGIFLVLQISFSLFAAKASVKKNTDQTQQIKTVSNIYSNLQISPAENKTYFTDSDVAFLIQLPSVKASNVQLRFSEFPNNVKFQSMQKNDTFDEDGNKVCEVEIVLKFMEKGVYKLPSVLFTINKRQYRFKFENVEIFDNPYNLVPEIIIKVLKNSKVLYSYETEKSYSKASAKTIKLQTGEKYNFLVYLKNVNQIQSFSWELPEDAIFSGKNDWLKEAEKINQKGKMSSKAFKEQNFSDYDELEKEVFLSEFEWTALREGKNDFPKLKASVTSYSDLKSEIILSDIPVVAAKSEKKEISDSQDDNFFEDAFSEIETKTEKTICEITLEQAEIIAQSKSKELWNDKKQRKLIKKGLLGINTSVYMYSIPEKTASKVYEINGGELVKILEQTEEWFYIGLVETPEKNGWCKKESVVLLK